MTGSLSRYHALTVVAALASVAEGIQIRPDWPALARGSPRAAAIRQSPMRLRSPATWRTEQVSGQPHKCSCVPAQRGALSADQRPLNRPGPEPPAPAALATVVCFCCRGFAPACLVCGGAGVASLTAQAAALRAA
jgi:hypothetical protein